MKSILVISIVTLAFAHRAYADDAAAARTLFKKGIEEYKAKKYGEASISLLKSYELDPKPDTLFALAQAERLDNRCPDALEHYKKLLAQTTDLPTAHAIQTNVELCAQPEKAVEKPAPVDVDKKPVEPAKPEIITKTVVKHERTSDPLATALLTTGGVAIGGSAVLFLASRNSRDDSNKATTLAESNRLFDRSKTERTLSLVTAGAGVALIAGGVIELVRGKPAKNEVAVMPIAHGGAAIALSSRW